MDLKSIAAYPIFFKRNRVGRIYDGGMLFNAFLGDEKADGKLPEEWIASSVKALNKDSSDPNEGISIIENTDLTFAELLRCQKKACLGGRDNLGVLVKYLDSAMRLPLQAHPDKEFSRRYFNSEYGKTEMWLVLATRPDAKIYIGFDKEVSEEEFSSAIERSLNEPQIMAELLREISVKAGDVFLIPAKCVHAIGYGCLILEVQEPTDFTISPEYWCGDYRLNEYEMYLGLKKSEALKCFDFGYYGEENEKRTRKIPHTIKETPDSKSESLISYADTPCFAVNRHTVSGTFALPAGPSVWTVTEGKGKITKADYVRNIKKGDYFFLPYQAKNFCVTAVDSIQLAECLPPL